MPTSASSSALQARRALADRLRELRLDAGLTAKDLAARAGWERTKVSKIEHGVRPPSADNIRAWCRVCGAGDEAADLVASLLAAEGMWVEWRRMERAGLKHAQEARLPLYERTRQFRAYASWVLPGLLQTEDYTRAVLRMAQRRRELIDDVDGAVAARMQRQRVLRRPGKTFAVLVEESVLRAGFGGSEVMTAQLEHLIDVGSLPSVSLGVVPAGPERDSARPVEDAVALLEASMNNTPVEIRRPAEDGGGRDIAGTLAAQEKKSAIDRAFAEWIFTDPERATRLVAEYNHRFNATVPPSYDGSALTLPGLGETYRPRKHQRDAVARIVAEPTVLLDHVVGAGKTGTMICGGMELRRLGLAHQPWYVVPNHLVEQFAREFTQWYPQASLLVGWSGMTPAERREFAATTAVAEWDAVIVPQSVFKQIPVSAETEAQHLERELARIEDALGTAPSGERRRVKELEKVLAKGKTRVQELRAGAGRDAGITFEQTGCDYLFVDEAHAYKNKRVVSGVREFDNSSNPSQQAEDLAVKLQVLRERNPAKVGTFATATPVANSLREMYVMQAFLAPDLLDRTGVATFDAWAANFCRGVTELETDVTGSGYRMHTRIARFVNTPELVEMTRQFSDVVSRDDLDLPLPQVAGGGRRPIVTEPSEQVAAYQSRLEKRAELIRARRVEPTEDNMLTVVNDGRKAALDPRLVGLPPDPTGGRIAVVAGEITRIHRAHDDRTFADVAGQTRPRRGGLQIVFCDRSTPAGPGWNVYTALRDQLADLGMDRSRVRFVHEARNDAERGELFEACRDGRVTVLIGSTEKMGTGVNIQARAIALHHVDCPWRPADLEQREGRIIRQGNQSTEVEIIGYATAGSLDTYMWQTVERKQRFIAQLRTGGQLSRTVEDIGDSDTISYAEFKAASSGNPLILEREQLVADISRLATLERAHHDEQRRLQFEARQAEHAAESAVRDIAALEHALTVRQPTDGDRFTMTLDGRAYTARTDAGRALFHLVAAAQQAARNGRGTDEVIGALGGFDIRATAARHLDKVELTLDDIPGASTNVGADELRGNDPGYGIIRRLEHHLDRIDTRLDQLREAEREHHTRAAETRDLIGSPFDRAADLAAPKERLKAVEAELAEVGDNLTKTDRRHAIVNTDSKEQPRASGRQRRRRGLRQSDRNSAPTPTVEM